MNVQSSPYAPSFARPAASVARPSLATAPVPLTEAEQAGIAAAFPAQPAVAHRLYGPTRDVQAPPQLGGRLDLSA